MDMPEPTTPKRLRDQNDVRHQRDKNSFLMLGAAWEMHWMANETFGRP